VPRGEGHEHDALPVGGAEVTGEAAVDVVADLAALDPVHLGLGQEPEVTGHRQGDVGQREADLLPLAGPAALPLGGQDCQGGLQPAGHVPGGQHMVDGTRIVRRSGDAGKAGFGVDGVVHGR
jgi:hypothetical protein